MQTFFQDVRYGLRQFVKNPAFSLLAILTLTLGVGANTAVFSVIYGVLLRPLSYHDPAQLVRLYDANSERGAFHGYFSPQDFDDLKASQRSFDSLAAFSFFPGNSGGTLIGVGEPHYLSSAYVSGDFFSTLQVAAERGRVLLPHDDVKGQNLSVVLSHGIWERQFGGDPNVVGRNVTVDTLTNGRASLTIVGIIPASFDYPTPQVEAWVPLSLVTDEMVPHRRGIRWLSAVGRLKPGVTVQQAQVETTLKLRQLENSYSDTNAGWGSSNVVSLRESIVGNVRPALLVLFGAVALVLLIACANISNLLLARGTSRAREIAVRSALGAERARLLRQLLTESLLMAFAGSAAGLLLAYGLVRVLVTISAGTIPDAQHIDVNLAVVGFCTLAAIVVWPLFGLMPAWKSSAINIVDALKKSATRASAGRQRTGMREMLVVGETAIAAMLLVATGLLLNSLWRLVHVDPGFNADRVLRLHLTVPSGLASEKQEQYRADILDRVAQVPAVVAVGGSKTVPLDGGGEPYEFGLTPFTQRGSIRPGAGAYIVTPGYFEALQIPVKAGRTFTQQDNAGKAKLLVVNESFAKKVWGTKSPVGQLLYVGPMACEVIGVVGDVHTEGLANEARETVYIPEKLSARSSLNLFVRTKGNPLLSIAAIRDAIWSVDKNQAVSDVTTMEQLLSDNVAQPRFFSVLLSVFGFLAVSLAAIGAYGVISYSVRERTQEFGIRIALGANRQEVLGLVLKQALRLTGIGLGLGLLGSLAAAAVIKSLLFGVKPLDPATFIAAAVFLFAVALAATYVPARAATKVDPIVALRYE
ncbi:MAG: ABC transporter permease [Acidobacteria bacterium]|nr:ABC transporter permease [Acidobacteriota bacterium]